MKALPKSACWAVLSREEPTEPGVSIIVLGSMTLAQSVVGVYGMHSRRRDAERQLRRLGHKLGRATVDLTGQHQLAWDDRFLAEWVQASRA